MATITCAVCNSEKANKVWKEFSATYNQTPISIPGAEMYECASCGERFFTPDQAKAVSLAVKRQARFGAGLLAPEEITAIRRRLGLTQSKLEQLFGLGSKVVTRWETGRVVQSKMADVALRLLDLDPENLTRLRLLRDESSHADAWKGLGLEETNGPEGLPRDLSKAQFWRPQGPALPFTHGAMDATGVGAQTLQ